MMKEEVWQRPIKRVICSSLAVVLFSCTNLIILIFNLLLAVNFISPDPVLRMTSASSSLLMSSGCFTFNTISQYKGSESHLHTLQNFDSLRNPLKQLRESLLVVLERNRLDLANTDREPLARIRDPLDYSVVSYILSLSILLLLVHFHFSLFHPSSISRYDPSQAKQGEEKERGYVL
jgi:hypothetical protein